MSDNPFQSPAVEHSPVIEANPAIVELRNWLLVFVINLPVALFFAADLLTMRGWVGAILALIAILFVGAASHARFPVAMRRIYCGGFIVAATQFFPILQLGCGGVAYGCLGVLGLQDPTAFLPKLDSVPAGFVVTTLTGLGLILVALLASLINFRPDDNSSD